MLIRKAALLVFTVATAILLRPVAPAPQASHHMVALPYHAVRAGSGHLQLQVLDPEDHVLAQSDRVAQAASGDARFVTALPPDDPTPFDDLVWQRVRYRFTYDDGAPAIEGTETIARVLRRPVLRILSQSTYLAGSPRPRRSSTWLPSPHRWPALEHPPGW